MKTTLTYNSLPNFCFTAKWPLFS